MADIKEYLRSPWFKGIITGMCIAIIMLIIFQAGVAVGFRKATFTHRFGDNYYRAFEPREGKFAVFLGDGVGAHGAAGKILSVAMPTFVVEGPDNIEKIVRIGGDTEIRRFRDAASTTDLRAGEFVVVIGEANEDAEIAAKLIRLLPPPPGIAL